MLNELEAQSKDKKADILKDPTLLFRIGNKISYIQVNIQRDW